MRAKLIIISFLLTFGTFFLGCGQGIHELNKGITFTGFDFRPYTNKGFLFTPEKYSGKYKSIGFISVNVYPEVSQDKFSIFTTEKIYNTTYGEHWFINKILSNEAVDSLYQHAKRMGADAVTRFHAETISKLDGTISIQGLMFSGFAIKREE